MVLGPCCHVFFFCLCKKHVSLMVACMSHVCKSRCKSYSGACLDGEAHVATMFHAGKVPCITIMGVNKMVGRQPQWRECLFIFILRWRQAPPGKNVSPRKGACLPGMGLFTKKAFAKKLPHQLLRWWCVCTRPHLQTDSRR